MGPASEVSNLLKESLAHLQRPTTFELPERIKSIDSKGSKETARMNLRWALATILLLSVAMFWAITSASKQEKNPHQIVATSVASDLQGPTEPVVTDGNQLESGIDNQRASVAGTDIDKFQVGSFGDDPPPRQRNKRASGVSSQRFLPLDTPVWFSIRDPIRLMEHLDKTQVGKLIMSPWMGPFVDQFGVDWRQLIAERFLPLPKRICAKEWVSGEVTFGFVEKFDVLQGRKLFSPYAFIDVSGSDRKAFDETKAEFAKLDGAKQDRIMLGDGNSVCMTSFDPSAAGRRKVIHGVADGWLVIGESATLVGELLKNAERGRAEDSLNQNPSFTKTIDRTRLHVSPDIVWFVNPLKLVELMIGTGTGDRDDTVKLLRKSGFDLFSGAGGKIAFATGQHEMIQRSFVCNSNKLFSISHPVKATRDQRANRENFNGLFLFYSSSQPGDTRLVKPSQWVPNGVASCLTADWNKGMALESCGPIYDEFIGESGSFQRLLNDFKVDPDLQLDIVKLVDQFDSRSSVIWPALPHDASNTGQPVFGLKISGDTEFVVQSLMRAINGKKIKIAGFDAITIDQQESENQQVVGDKFGLPGDEVDIGSDPVEPNFYVIVNDVLLMSDSKDQLRELIKNKNGKLIESPDYLKVHASLGQWAADDDVNIRHFGRLDSSLRSHYHKFRAGKFEWFDWIKRDDRDQPSEELSTVDVDGPLAAKQRDRRRRRWFDGSKLPADFDKLVAPFLGSFGWILEAEDDGWLITGCVLDKGPPRRKGAGGFRQREPDVDPDRQRIDSLESLSSD